MVKDEKLDKTNMLRVIGLLEQEKPITKKSACEILNITYNTPRLGKLIKEFKEREEGIKKARARLRGTPVSAQEQLLMAEEYLDGSPVSTISDMTFRPVSLIQKTIEDLNIPPRTTDASYQNPDLLDEDAISEDYDRNDLVYAARYQCPAFIEKRTDTKFGPVYMIYLLAKEQCYASQPYWELADLTRLQKELGLKLKPQEGLQPSYNP